MEVLRIFVSGCYLPLLNSPFLSEMSDEEEDVLITPKERTVKASNIAPLVNQDTLRQFFGFCGPIEKLAIVPVKEYVFCIMLHTCAHSLAHLPTLRRQTPLPTHACSPCMLLFSDSHPHVLVHSLLHSYLHVPILTPRTSSSCTSGSHSRTPLMPTHAHTHPRTQVTNVSWRASGICAVFHTQGCLYR